MKQLDAYEVKRISRPDMPDVERWIDREDMIIYINTAAAPDAKIVVLC